MSWIRAGLSPAAIARRPSRLVSMLNYPRNAFRQPIRHISSSTPPPSPVRGRGRVAALALLALGGGGVILYEVDTHLNASVLQRNIRTAIVGAQIALVSPAFLLFLLPLTSHAARTGLQILL